jgi:MoaA/NifB/PqqE/SkfB family radical SAM enzyme
VGHADGLYNGVQRVAVKKMLALVVDGDKSKILRAFKFAEMLTPSDDKRTVRILRDKIQSDHPALLLMRRAVGRLNPVCRERFIENVIVNDLLRGQARRNKLVAKTGMLAPITVLVSPSMRCNLACEGCYASEYSPDQDLDRALLQRIVDEGNEMGVYLFTFLGGEPFLYPRLLEFARTNPDSYFQIFTNGTLLTEAVVQEMAELGNVAPMLSIDGTPEFTDWRRGPGVHQKVMAAMDLLSKAGVLFGYSATVTGKNWQTLISDEFVDRIVEKGGALGWHFLYMPIGRQPDIELMPTPAQREAFRNGIVRIRETKPLFPVDFWGDAPWVGGCIAGRHYMHITSEGWVEPCIFTHFATDNIKDVGLMEAFNSPYFKQIRTRQPYNDNLLRPCMWIDNPAFARDIMTASGAKPTHDGADSMLDLEEELDAYALESAAILDPAWECMRETLPSKGRFKPRPDERVTSIAS